MGAWLEGLEERIIREARERQKRAMDAGVQRNLDYLNRYGKDAAGVQGAVNAVMDMTAQGDRLPENLRSGVEAAMKDGRRRKTYAKHMDRGFLGGERGPMEALNQLIAENAMVRRGVLPGAIGAGGVAGVTAAGRGLFELADYMSGNSEPRLEDVAALVSQGLTAEQAVTLLSARS